MSAAIAKAFFWRPRRIQDDEALCGAIATDHPSVRIMLFGFTTKTVGYYARCYMQVKDCAVAGSPGAASYVRAWKS